MDDAVTVPGTRVGVGLDAVIGLVPGIGDLVGSALSGVIVRANRKNLRLLLREVEREPLREPPSPAYVAGAVALMLVPVLAGIVVAVLGIWLLWRLLT
ncbi:DUF4112 domain-containing protein [Nocardioides eburneiflavus]|uniref:DUF4112 domain-containing protein n=2 Tax=Nocardioides eburneiflavus TaxID=2518372 RepID=A0A4Z1CPF7_9ACTN|nr:DUF4112 domain-containing protein [Nocardioides eburneiflavus]